MRSLVSSILLLLLAGCGSSSGGVGAPVDAECTSDGQKQFVLDAARDWYLWNNLLPADINIDDYASPTALLNDLRSYSPNLGSGPVDRFGGIDSALSDQQFFGEGIFEGFGFSYVFGQSDLRLRFVYESSPAYDGGLRRGQRITEINGRTVAEILAAEGPNGVYALLDLETVTLTVDALENPTTISRGEVTIDPIPQWRLIPVNGAAPIGYIEFAQFISTADPVFETIFAELRANNVTDLIIDMRYNGGGLVTTTERLGDHLGGFVASNLVFSDTRYNADRSDQNRIKRFSLLQNSLDLSRLVIIATSSTASASELITNGMEPHVEVTIVGSDTFGKPVGQSGFEFCENILRLTTFQLFNADGFGEYYDGLPVDCATDDDLGIPVGADSDPNLIAARTYLETGACPVASAPSGVSKASFAVEDTRPEPRGHPYREFTDAW